MEVEYRTIDRFPDYRFCADGSVWSSISGQWKKLSLPVSSRGYPMVGLRDKDGKIQRCIPVHRLILEAFVGPCPEGHEARHFPDGNRANNAISNLSWGTRSQNFMDKWPQGTMPHGEGHGRAYFTEAKITEIRRRYLAGERQVHLAAEFGVRQAYISNIVRRKIWRHLP
jgi:hypothetical protein